MTIAIPLETDDRVKCRASIPIVYHVHGYNNNIMCHLAAETPISNDADAAIILDIIIITDNNTY